MFKTFFQNTQDFLLNLIDRIKMIIEENENLNIIYIEGRWRKRGQICKTGSYVNYIK